MDYRERDAHSAQASDATRKDDVKIGEALVAPIVAKLKAAGVSRSPAEDEAHKKRVAYLAKVKAAVDQVRILEARLRDCYHMLILLDKYVKGGWHAPEVRVAPGTGPNLEPKDHNVVRVQAKFMLTAVHAQHKEYGDALVLATNKLLGLGYGASQ